MFSDVIRQPHASACAVSDRAGRADETSETTMDRTDESLIALRRILRATELYGRDLARDAGLTAVQLRVLQIVAERGRCHPSDVASQMGVSQATISVLIKKLVSYNLIERRQSARDGRQIDLTITPSGLEKVEAAPDALQQRYVAQFEALPAWEQSMVVAVLERVAGMLDAGQLDAAPVLAMGDITRMHQQSAASNRESAPARDAAPAAEAEPRRVAP
ncbi:putative HTH-type transcriptional regulator YusO [Roseivivax jejudonensis]|uniref:Putative HTH-type transcriptional regulator YusO n=1 Tax=Roseivivax jejudonensis TaxID=1529041 RepID=A0A1X7A4A1_9RHOB|nr:MarR family transcriptional regulator [Roseivivax jejudonensis]SLN69780.1 putative HTH-type transcriptional regulator YusO [Roseivivax jejudonensis]